MPCPRDTGRPVFNDLLFGRREPVYVAFDVLFVDGEDVRALPLKERRATLEKVVRRHRMQKSEPLMGDGKAAFRAVCGLDLEGIVAKRLADAYDPRRTRWWKTLNRDYSQKAGRAEPTNEQLGILNILVTYSGTGVLESYLFN